MQGQRGVEPRVDGQLLRLLLSLRRDVGKVCCKIRTGVQGGLSGRSVVCMDLFKSMPEGTVGDP